MIGHRPRLRASPVPSAASLISVVAATMARLAETVWLPFERRTPERGPHQGALSCMCDSSSSRCRTCSFMNSFWRSSRPCSVSFLRGAWPLGDAFSPLPKRRFNHIFTRNRIALGEGPQTAAAEGNPPRNEKTQGDSECLTWVFSFVLSASRRCPALALDGVVDLEHFRFTGKLDPDILQHRHQPFAERVELLS
jgi:hypothetical protein